MPRKATDAHRPPFEGFRSPRYTQVPDELFDRLMPQLSDAELRVLLYIVRRTFGFKRDTDNISLSQMVEGITTKDGTKLDYGAGVSKASAVRAVKGLLAIGAITKQTNKSVERGHEATTYALRFFQDPLSHHETSPLVSPRDMPLSHHETYKKQGVQQTDVEFRKAQPEKIDETDGAGKIETATLPLVVDQSGSQELIYTEPPSPNRDAISDQPVSGHEMPQDGRQTPETEEESLPAPPRDLTELVTPQTPSQTPPQEEGEGFRRLREQAMRIRAENAARREAEQLVAAGGSATNAARSARRGRPPGSQDERDQLWSYLKDFAVEFSDQAPLSSTITRAYNTFQKANVPRERWGDFLYQARSITLDHSSSITKQAPGAENTFRFKNKAPYYFAILEDLVGLREQTNPTPSSTS